MKEAETGCVVGEPSVSRHGLDSLNPSNGLSSPKKAQGYALEYRYQDTH